ncbi:hypothetical protein ABZ749_00680, partial [Micromonospora sp. NPDC047753]
MLAPGRRLICATCPSTHTQPSLAIQAPTFWLTTRTGQGSSALLAPLPPPLAPPLPTRPPSLTRPPYGPPPPGPSIMKLLPSVPACRSNNFMINAGMGGARAGGGWRGGTYDGVVTEAQATHRTGKRVLLAKPRGYCAGV